MTTPVLTNAPAHHLTQALLPWESEEDFLALHADWKAVYDPQGPAETALVDQLVWIDWRRRRLVLGERAVHMAQLHARTGTGGGYDSSDALVKRAVVHHEYRLRKFDSQTVVATTPNDDASLSEFAMENLKRQTRALEILEAGGVNAYTDALCYLEEDSLEWWDEERGDATDRYPSDAQGLSKFLKAELKPWLMSLKCEADERPDVRLQAHGESLDPHRMNTLLGLDERLGRQFEKAMGMLIKLQEIRGNAGPGS